MKALTILSKQKLNLILLSVLIVSFNPAVARSDKQIMADVQKARAMARQSGDHQNIKSQLMRAKNLEVFIMVISHVKIVRV